jgi:low temperature requirement protein LtrA
VLVFAGLFSSVWWAWAGFTFYANRFDTDDVVYRLAKLGAMLAVAGLAASATDATGSLARQFAFCQAAIRLVLVALYLRAYRHVVPARGLIVVYLTAGAVAAGLWLAGAMASGPARYAAWVVAVAVEVTAPVVATRRSAGLPLHPEHLPERLGSTPSIRLLFQAQQFRRQHQRPAGQFVRFSAGNSSALFASRC